jgi:hypothetical protein
MNAAASEKPRAVDVKGWGTIHVREITVAEVEQQNDDTANKKDKNRIARAAARILCDEAGTRLFDPENEADVALLAKQTWKRLLAVINAGDEDIKAATAGN